MERRSFLFLLFSGLCFLPSCFPRLYVLVKEPKTWADAQRYCRQKYTDLASVNNQEQSDQLMAAAQTRYEYWIGLSEDKNSWRWSLEDKDFYGEGEEDFRFWQTSQPNNSGGHQNCTIMVLRSRWNDMECDSRFQFVCYDGKSDANTSSNFVYVNKIMTWKEAQSYCRRHHTDLASVRNQTEHDAISTTLQSVFAWIGLYKDSWQWSDGSPYLFRNWSPVSSFRSSCVLLHDGKWKDHNCNHIRFFFCHIDPRTLQVLRVKLTKQDSSLNLEDSADDILQQLSQMLKDDVSEQVKLTWRKQPNGKIFKLEKEEKKEKKENTCT